MFELKYTLTYLKVYKKYVLKDQKLQKALEKTLDTIKINPFHTALKTHRVDTRRNFDVWSSSVTGDWRVVWVFDNEVKSAAIICLELGTHSGANQIYKI